VRVRVRLRERVERLVKHVRRVALGALLKTASTHWPAQAAWHRAAREKSIHRKTTWQTAIYMLWLACMND